MRTRRQPDQVQREAAGQTERGSRIRLLPRSAGATDENPNGGHHSATSHSLMVVRIFGGPRDGERFATRLTGLTEGTVFNYFNDEYTFTRDPRTGRWRAIPARPNDQPARTKE